MPGPVTGKLPELKTKYFTAVRTSRQELGKRVLAEYEALKFNITYLPDQFSISNVRKPDNTEEEKARVVS